MLNINNFEKDVRVAHENGVKYLIVGLLVCGKKEMIIIERDGFIDKLKYYKESYTDNLVMKNNKDIKIAKYMFSDRITIDILNIEDAV